MARTRAVDYGEKRNAILERSAALFAQKGVDRASMAEIARACGVSKALLYHYYAGKDELVFDIIHTHLSQMDSALAAVKNPDDPAETQIRKLVGEVLDIYRDADHLHKVQLNGIPALPAEKAEKIKQTERSIVRRFSDAVDALNPELGGKDKKLLTPVTMSIMGILNWVYMWFRDDGGLSRSAYADAVTDMVINGIRPRRGDQDSVRRRRSSDSGT